ncbi:E3 ubiquitin-protein ligase RBBP6-like [Patagioenas fasciata]|uniref:E3 ubiquitin-protein ligase RBBP6-like n=1 Tax=Patagioenas fasciata TaxID=372321 RepID=UPI0032E8B8EC
MAVAAGQPVLLPQPLGDPSPHHCGTCLGAKVTPPSATVTPVQSRAPTVSCIHYKFSSKVSCDTVTFHGLNIALGNLKQQIMSHEKLKVANCGLQITNTQTKKEYLDDNTPIPKNSSVIVRRVPAGAVKAPSRARIL